jgi:hypothetical protein
MDLLFQIADLQPTVNRIGLIVILQYSSYHCSFQGRNLIVYLLQCRLVGGQLRPRLCQNCRVNMLAFGLQFLQVTLIALYLTGQADPFLLE